MDISKFVVRAGGSINRAASVAAFETVLDQYLAEESVESGVIGDAVNAVFDKHPGASINMPALQSAVTGLLNATPANYAVLSEKARQYVRQNSQGEKDSAGNFENPESLFLIQKGKGGGVRRRSDTSTS
jgi:hypothetical protein